jgi:small subunit ribosomal protein S8
MVRDVLSDTLIRIKNGYNLRFGSIFVLQSRKVIRILDLLYLEGFIRGYSLEKENKIKVLLKYALDGKAVLRKIIILSKPGRKIFVSSKSLWLLDVVKGSGCFFLTTSKGFMSLKKALKYGIGGELICYVL